MPLYEYECPEHGPQDHLLALRADGPYQERPCNYILRTFQVPAQPNWLIIKEKCKIPSKLMVSAPAIVNVEQDWNEKANDAQRDPYTQAKAQLTNHSRTEAEHGRPEPKVTEAGIQVAARQIATDKKKTPISDAQRHGNVMKKAKKAKINKSNG